MDSEAPRVHPDMADLLKEIEEFLAVTGMGPSYFGRVAAGNTELVERLRNGAEVLRRTERKVRDYIKCERIRRDEFPDGASSGAAA
jgi:hypothetical protein